MTEKYPNLPVFILGHSMVRMTACTNMLLSLVANKSRILNWSAILCGTRYDIVRYFHVDTIAKCLIATARLALWVRLRAVVSNDDVLQGGLIAIKMVLDHPDIFKGMILIGPLINFSPETATPFKVVEKFCC